MQNDMDIQMNHGTMIFTPKITTPPVPNQVIEDEKMIKVTTPYGIDDTATVNLAAALLSANQSAAPVEQKKDQSVLPEEAKAAPMPKE